MLLGSATHIVLGRLLPLLYINNLQLHWIRVTFRGRRRDRFWNFQDTLKKAQPSCTRTLTYQRFFWGSDTMIERFY